jgi:hypothetical protein
MYTCSMYVKIIYHKLMLNLYVYIVFISSRRDLNVSELGLIRCIIRWRLELQVMAMYFLHGDQNLKTYHNSIDGKQRPKHARKLWNTFYKLTKTRTT